MDGILAVDPDGRISVINDAALSILDSTNEQIPTWDALAPYLPFEAVDQVNSDTQHVIVPDTHITRRTGETVPVRLVSNKLILDGKYLGTAFSLQDLSGIKKLQNEKLEAEKLAAIGQTVAGLAHGVKNLITALEGGMYMLKSGVQKADITRLENGMAMLSRNIDRMSAFVKAFLSFSKGRKINPSMNYPAEIVKEVVDMYMTKAESTGVRLVYDLKDGLPPAPVDAESLHECLANLVGNALDACRMRDDEAYSIVTVRLSENDDVIYIVVTDNGCGMDDETKKKLFTTFFTTKGLDGTGLGLMMSKKIIQDHGGMIDVVSEPGKGSTFLIRLPRNLLPQISDT
jgi:signal transduction histidine kinase